ncbi:MAG: hypothetical protein ACYCS8_00725 [Acidithiobacillus sp.]
MSKLPVLRLNKKSQQSRHAVELSASAADNETPAVRRTRRRIERLERMKAQLLEQMEQRERAIQDQRWMAVIRKVAPDWSLETVAGGLAAAFAECREDPTYFEEITTFGKTLLSETPDERKS